MEKINLNILGLKNFENEDLDKLLIEAEKVKVDFGNDLYTPFSKLRMKIRIEQNKRKRRDWVWLEFTCSWSGYSNNPSAPRKDIGKIYRKVKKELVEKIGSYYSHTFSDNSTNDWGIKVVSTNGKDTGSYSHQIDEYLSKIN